MEVVDETNENTDSAAAKQGKVTGVIIPPPDIRARVDKTASFVAKNGKAFEQRILNSEDGKTAKFNFMRPFDPYHAYYEMKIREFEEGKDGTQPTTSASSGESKSDGTATTTAAAAATAVTTNIAAMPSTSTMAKASLTTPIARFAMNKPTTAPSAFEFTIGQPTNLSAVEVDIIKLTAQYTAANGREFLAGLAQREQRNPQYDFLKPSNMVFSYFTSLVDAYSKILMPTAEQKEHISSMQDRMKVLESAVHRWEWERQIEETKREKNMVQDEERSAFQAIDWFDFAVVETIDFPEDELYDMPSLSLGGSGPMGMMVGALGGVSRVTAMSSSSSSKGRMVVSSTGDDMDIDDNRPQMDRHIPPPPPPTRPRLPGPPGQLLSGQLPGQMVAPEQEDEDMEMEGDDDDNAMYGGGGGVAPMEEGDQEQYNVVSDYTLRMAGSGSSQPMTMIDPISGKMLPVSEVDQHMKVQLMDPRWRVEHKRFQDKQRESGFAEGGSIADNLKQFARKREDIFGDKAKPPNAAALAAAQEAEEKRKAEIIWDGDRSSIEELKRQKAEAALRAGPPKSVTSVVSSGPTIGPMIPGMGTSAPLTLPPPVIMVNPNAAPMPPPIPMGISSGPMMHVPPSMNMGMGMPGMGGMPMQPPPPVLDHTMQQQPLIPPSMPSHFQPMPPPMQPPLPTMQPPPLPTMQQPPLPMHPPLPSSVQFVSAEADVYGQPGKRARNDDSMIVSAEEFASRYPHPITVFVSTPLDNTNPAWSLTGELVNVPSVSVTMSIKDLKEMVTSIIGIPTSKFQLKATDSTTFFKDLQTLAELNLGDQARVDLSVKTRR